MKVRRMEVFVMNSEELKIQLKNFGSQLLKLRFLLFAILLIAVFAFVVWQFSVNEAASPSASAILDATPPAASSPSIDQTTINKIKHLKNNSVNVRALFNKSRQNPFNE
jgi:flagellar basal body-associated protein FliL